MKTQQTITTVPLIKPDLPTLADIAGPIEEILSNGKITNFSKYVKQFEAEAGGYLGTQTVSLSSGTMGLLFTLQALGLKPGQKVILPSFTFMATAQAIVYAGGIPVFAEIEEDLNLSPSDLDSLLRQHDDVGAVIAVHMYGLPAQAAKITAIVEDAGRRLGRKIPLIFDAAHAFGAQIGGVKVGGFGDAEVFSLSVTKVLVTVEGGLVSTTNHDLVERIRRMRNYGIESSYNAHYPGMNGKMSEFHAIVGLHNLRRIDSLMAKRQEKARQYKQRIEEKTSFRLTSWPSDMTHTFKDFTIRVLDTAKRDSIIAFLTAHGVETRAYFYPPVHEQECFRHFATRPLPVTERLAREVVTLPFFTTIEEADMDYVSDVLKKAEAEIL